jgi:dCMP deaminase
MERPTRELLHLIEALQWSRRSLCKRAKVGCVITTGDGRITLARGYNGPARGLSNDRCRELEGSCGCLHAEMNAIALVDSTISNKAMFSTTSPCEICAQLILQANITTIWYIDEYRDQRGLDLMRPYLAINKVPKDWVIQELCKISAEILHYAETSLYSTLKQTVLTGSPESSVGPISPMPENLVSWIKTNRP